MDPLEKFRAIQDMASKTTLERFQELANEYSSPIRYYPSPAESQAVRMAEIARSIRTAPQTASEDLQEAVHTHITTLQSGLAADEQLLVCCQSSLGLIFVHDIGFPNWHTVILLGKDAEGNAASMVLPASLVQLTCKVVKVQPPEKPYVIGFIRPDTNAE